MYVYTYVHTYLFYIYTQNRVHTGYTYMYVCVCVCKYVFQNRRRTGYIHFDVLYDDTNINKNTRLYSHFIYFPLLYLYLYPVGVITMLQH